MDYNIWIEPDSQSGVNYLKFSGKIAINDENLQWVSSMTQKLKNGDVNYINPLFSSDPSSKSEISVGLLPALKSEE
jgi:hypothetical protein